MKLLANSLKLGMTMPVYIFCGTESLLMEDAVQQVAALVAPDGQDWNREILRGDEHSADDVVQACQSVGFLAGRRLVLVRDAQWLKPRRRKSEDADERGEDAVRDDNSMDEQMQQRLLAYLADPNPGTVLVMTVQGSINRNTRVAKAVAQAGRIVEFNSPKGMEREQWLAAYWRKLGKQADAQVCSYLCLMCGEGLTQLKAEADKLALYCSDKTVISMQDAEEIVCSSSLAVVFDLTDCVLRKEAAKAVELLRRLLRQGESPFALIGMLANQYRTVLAAKDLLQHGYAAAEIGGMLGVNPYFAKKCAAQSRSMSFRQLLRVLEILLIADRDAKTGRQDADSLLEVAILKICAL